MSFTPIYYICIACPTVDRTLEMIETYIENGARAFQIDMPSKNPFSETEFVKQMMSEGLNREPDYDAFMDAIRTIRKKHPDLEIHIVVYNDVIDSIGLEKFIAFCKEIFAASLMIPGSSSENLLYAELNGFKVFRSVTHELPEVRIILAAGAGGDGMVGLRNKKPGEIDVPGYETLEKKYRYILSRGVKSPVYNVFGVTSAEEVKMAKDIGMRGVIVGNALMKMWGDKEMLAKTVREMQALAE